MNLFNFKSYFSQENLITSLFLRKKPDDNHQVINYAKSTNLDWQCQNFFIFQG